MVRIFLSYCFDDEAVCQRINYYLRKQPGVDSYCYADERRTGGFAEQLEHALGLSQAFVFVLGRRVGDTQLNELQRAIRLFNLKDYTVVVNLGGLQVVPAEVAVLGDIDPILLSPQETEAIEGCAKEIVARLSKTLVRNGKDAPHWVADDDLPVGYPFDYEKNIIREYVEGNGRLSGRRLEEGCSPDWPRVTRRPAALPNPVPKDETGEPRDDDARISVLARWSDTSNVVSDDGNFLKLPEAGPRERLRYPLNQNNYLKVGILVSGGIAPGINAVINGIVERHILYAKYGNYNVQIYGYREGFNALIRQGQHFTQLHTDRMREDLKRQANEGGSILPTSRAKELLRTAGLTEPDSVNRSVLLEKSLDRLVQTDDVQILYVIGGDGSMSAAHSLWKYSEDRRDAARRQGGTSVPELSVVAIPKTMDNDILWCWQSFGFSSAVERTKDIVQQLHMEAVSNPRLGIIQVFGSDSGFVVSHAALASGVCDLALIPEVNFTMAEVCRYMRQRLAERLRDVVDGRSPHGLILMAETAIPQDVYRYFDDPDVGLTDHEKGAIESFISGGRRVRGQTTDELRSGGLKIVSKVLERDIQAIAHNSEYWKRFRVFTNEPRHVIRAIPPSASDVNFAQRLGALAVDNALAGYTDFMISQWLTEYVLVPLRLVVLGRKRVPRDGIFWRSTLTKTGQPHHLGTVMIGITGHRSLNAMTARIRSGVDEALRAIETRFAEPTWTLFSPLAEGADRLVADYILTSEEERRPVQLVVPVPKGREEEEVSNTRSAASRAGRGRARDIEQLRARAHVIDVKLDENSASPGEEAARCMLQYCDVLIAVWDGKIGPGRRGTGSNVAWARERRLPIAWIHAGNDGASLGTEQGRVTFENFP